MRFPTTELTLCCVFFCLGSLLPAQTARDLASSSATWHFAVSGDSRNCGDVVMPGIAAGVLYDHAVFYWHLGDLRWISDVDQDFKQLAVREGQPTEKISYEGRAWDDFIQHQISPFGQLPFYLGIGNHETVLPKTRAEFVNKFARWLDTPALAARRLKDNPGDHQVKTYYHWIRGGIDFINLDNASPEEFDSQQMKWFEGILAHDAADASIITVVVGMHEALPGSLASDHSMDEWRLGEETGRQVYQDLLKLQNSSPKNVYVLASHSHYFMDGIFNTEYWRTHGGVLPGWIVGTAGAVRYRLPANFNDANAAETDVYGYLLATVNPPGQRLGTVRFDFKLLREEDVPAEIVRRFTPVFVHECFVGNRR